ncbi:hypothetical protein K0M31_020425 [Melipona bicolor]|uniref:Uncharacterized protein n=1 Tax=Melipona bicolor TaxID=60889 RepID=A0AA40KQR2_9HYME|nr:hypothetical protein K0M31_020425 [Melipona bicolor]
MTTTTVRKEKEAFRQHVTLFSCNTRLSKKKAALRYFPSLDNIGNTIFSDFITLGHETEEKIVLRNGCNTVEDSEELLLDLPIECKHGDTVGYADDQ